MKVRDLIEEQILLEDVVSCIFYVVGVLVLSLKTLHQPILSYMCKPKTCILFFNIYSSFKVINVFYYVIITEYC